MEYWSLDTNTHLQQGVHFLFACTRSKRQHFSCSSSHCPEVGIWIVYIICASWHTIHLVQWITWRMFPIWSPPNRLLSLSSSLCFQFSSQEVIYSQTHSNSQPRRHAGLSQHTPNVFIFSVFSPLFFCCHQAHLFISLHLLWPCAEL